VFILWDEIRHVVLVAWLIYTITLSLGRAWLTYAYWHRPPPPIKNSHWDIWYLAGIALSGLGWGSVGIFLFVDASLPHQLFLAFVLAGMTAWLDFFCSPCPPCFPSPSAFSRRATTSTSPWEP